MSDSPLNGSGTILLAPLAGFTDIAFRELCSRYGTTHTCTEMVSAKGVAMGDARSLEMTRISAWENNGSVQLFGDDPGTIATAMETILSQFEDNTDPIHTKPAYFDLNAGCPVRKVITKKAGSYLLKHPEILGRILGEMVEATDRPVSVKVRLGWKRPDSEKETEKRWEELARTIEDAGVSFVTIHGRYMEDGYGGFVDRESLARFASRFSIPVVANGDIRNSEDARGMLQATGCSHLMVGRGALADPTLPGRLSDTMEDPSRDNTQAPTSPTPMELTDLYIELARKHQLPFSVIKRHASFFVKGYRLAKNIRTTILTTSTIDEVRELVASVPSTRRLAPDQGISRT